jgi:PIN domain nuclease of toxin-antitoxin system
VSWHLDTHVAIWMAAGERRRLRAVQQELRRGPLFLSPVALVEMEILHEIGRIRHPAAAILAVLAEAHGVEEAPGDVRDLAHYARVLAWTRDPFDRLIVAHALASGSVLLTADETIRKNCPQARWE